MCLEGDKLSCLSAMYFSIHLSLSNRKCITMYVCMYCIATFNCAHGAYIVSLSCLYRVFVVPKTCLYRVFTVNSLTALLSAISVYFIHIYLIYCILYMHNYILYIFCIYIRPLSYFYRAQNVSLSYLYQVKFSCLTLTYCSIYLTHSMHRTLYICMICMQRYIICKLCIYIVCL